MHEYDHSLFDTLESLAELRGAEKFRNYALLKGAFLVDDNYVC
jgi:hypothetical protein